MTPGSNNILGKENNLRLKRSYIVLAMLSIDVAYSVLGERMGERKTRHVRRNRGETFHKPSQGYISPVLLTFWRHGCLRHGHPVGIMRQSLMVPHRAV
eukprot:scaffold516_cov175-Amphora_coffeaeformis.AAC.31